MTTIPHSHLVDFADIRPRPIDDWQQYKLAGRQFLNLAATAYRHNNQVFTPEILYNLIAMGIEKLVMSGLMEIGRLPYNHTMHDLVSGLEEWLPAVIQGMAEPIRNLDSYQDICDPYACVVKVPAREEIAAMLSLARQLERRLEAASV